MKKFVATVLALTMAASLAACGGSGSTAETAGGSGGGSGAAQAQVTNRVVIGLTNTVQTLQPFNGANPYYNMITGEVYQKLGQRHSLADGTFEKVLMKSYEQVDGTTYNVELYSDIYDSNGVNMKASDVAFCLAENKAQGVSGAAFFDSAEVTGDYTLTVKLINDSLGAFETMCENDVIVTEESYKGSADGMATIPVGTGPYKVTEFTTGSKVVLVKDDNFWMAKSAEAKVIPSAAQNIPEIEFNFLTETTQMALAVENGTVQMAQWLNESIVEDCKNVEGVTVDELMSPQICEILFNQTDASICSDENFRKAVAYGVNSQAVVDNVLYGVGEVSKALGKAGQNGYNEAWETDYEYYPYDVEKAKEYLAKSGYNGQTIKIMIMSLPSFEAAAQVLQADLQALGITSQIDEYDDVTWGKYLPANTGYTYDITLHNVSMKGAYLMQTLATYLDQNQYQDGHNMEGAADPELQKLVDACMSTEWTQEDYDKFYQYVYDHCLIYQWYNNAYSVAHINSISIPDDARGALKGELLAGACVYN